ncbi:MAG: amino acid adenylation domain-containing protein [Acidobacteria bacterium]|nr:amino acid adenylation domain-containing protein [Acidobacteriota bacterium]
MKHEEIQGGPELQAEDYELLSYLLQEEGLEDDGAPVIRPRAEGEPPQMSYAQQRLWFIDQLAPGQPAYNIPYAVRLTGQLRVPVLERALTEIVRRHEVLRTTFLLVEGEPTEVVAPAAGYTLPVVDLTALPAGEREAEARRLAVAEARRPFDLAAGPLLRVGLLRLSEQEHVALITMHHIVSDGWSVGIFVREVAALYRAYAEGAGSPLPELPIQYADFAAWQREWLRGEVLEEQLGYWKRHLGGGLPVLDLPTDRPRPPVQTFRGARRFFEIDAQTSRALKSLARAEGATLFMALLAAYQVLLHRYTGQDDVRIGTPVAGRNRAEVEGLIGFFVNTLVLRTDLSDAPTFRELLRRAREVSLESFARQDLPFQKLVEELQPERDLSRPPLFQVWFVLQNAPLSSLDLPGLTIAPFEVDSGIAQFDLSLDMTETEQGLSGSVAYNSDLFDPETIGRLIGHFQTLLASAAHNPDRSVAQLELLTPAEVELATRAWNDTGAGAPDERCAHELFEAQAALTPDAVAVRCGEQSLTYAELDGRANRLANFLRRQGVGPEVLVGICMTRVPELVVGLLGVLKAGGAYVPLDPAYPFEHLAFVTGDAQMPVLLTQTELEDRLPAHWGHLFCLDADWDAIGAEGDAPPPRTATPNNLAYIIYTSGSTGRPKGAQVEHRGLVNYLDWCLSAYGVGSGEGAPVHSSVAFDLTVTSLFAPLVAGRAVDLLSDAEGVDGLADALRRSEDYSLVKITPAHLDALTQMLPADEVAGRTHAFVIGGEALTWQQLEFWRAHAPATRLINEYGPTETVVGCCVYEVGAETGQAGGVPIGRPITNARIYLLDQYKQLVPVGVRGELHVGGVGVGRGYLRRPGLTAERFVPDPFSDEPGARLYATGDLARYRADGTIEFLGRADTQVKVRGFRVELGEVEAALGSHPHVARCAVVLREDAPGAKQLVGYVVPVEGETVAAAELARHLKGKLPEYEVPSAFVTLEALPLTVNGKLDSAVLPAPDTARPDLGSAYARPRTETEQLLAGVWADVLRLDEVGVHDNFFDLGGHSLLAVQVISRVRELFHLELAVRDLFEAPTVAGLAEAIDRARGTGGQGTAPPIKPVPRDGGLPLSFAQQRLWFVCQLNPASPAYNIPAAIRLTGRLDVRALEQTVGELLRRHESLRVTFDIAEGRLVQLVQEARPATLPIIDLTELPAAEREREALKRALEEAQEPFDLATGPLLRVGLLRLSEQEHVVLLTMHHIVSDGWSAGVLIREVGALYGAFSRGEGSPLAELAVQYADYAAWQREWLSGEVLEGQLSYWRRQLSGVETLELPTDRPRPPVQTYRGAHRQFTLKSETAGALRALARAEGATLFMTLLAAFQTLLHRHTGQEEVTVGTPVAGRNRAEVEGLIGFFVNTLVLRTDLSGAPTFRELLRRSREVSLDAFAHQDVPFEKLVEELQPERDPSRPPLAQVFFTLENPQRESLALPGLVLTPLETEPGTVKYDLVLGVADTGEELRARFDYNVDLFEEGTVARMVEHFITLLDGIAADPDARLAKLPLLTEAERRQLVDEWNDTRADFSSEHCIHQLFERQVEHQPEAVALTYEGTQLSYAELNARSNRLARHLLRVGVRAEVRVGLCVERSPDAVVGLLAVLKAGGVYVPLDPNYPAERLAYMLEDAGVRVLLTQEHLRAALPPHDAHVLCLDTDWAAVEGESAEPPGVRCDPAQLAYVIYTSGSTGRPKGTMLQHRGLCNMVEAQIALFDVRPDSRVLQFASLSFDASVSEIFMALCSGAALCLAPGEALLPGPGLVELLRTQSITTVTLPPAVLAVLPDGPLPALRTIVTAGEACPAEVAERWSEHRLFVNAYGPTEATVCATAADCSNTRTAPTIGQAIHNTTSYVLDRSLEPVPVGVPGELYVGGAGLARGYLNRPGLTAERFIPDPFSGEPGARLYRTGDSARRLADGRIDFLGRLDNQVKLRGFRIELGEIEAALRAEANVQDCAVIVREDAPGDKRLVAYLVAEGDAPPAADLRAALRRRLPEHMLPSAFVTLDALPLTANGKVNRRALPAPAGSRPLDEATFEAPTTSVERRLVEIWEEVLREEHIGVNDNFFELGGHSLLMVEVRGRLAEVFGLDVSVADLFRFPTISALARFLEDELAQRQQQPPPAAEPEVAATAEGVSGGEEVPRARQAGAGSQRQTRRARRAAEQQDEEVRADE